MRYFSLPDFIDAKDAYLARINAIILVPALFASLVAIGVMYAHRLAVGLVVSIMLLLLLIAAWMFIANQRLKPAAWLTIIAIWCGITLFAFSASSFLLAFITTYAVVIVVGAMLIGPMVGFVLAISSVAMTLIIPNVSFIRAQTNPVFTFDLTVAALISAASLFIIVGLIQLYSQRSRAAFEQNQQQQERFNQLTRDLEAARYEAENREKSAHTQFDVVLDSAPTGLLLTDSKGVIRFINKQAERIFGYQRVELLGQPVEMLVPDGFKEKHKSMRDVFSQRPAMRLMAGRELHGLRRDGSKIPIEIGLSPIESVDGNIVMVYIQDISDRRRAEDALQKERNLLNSLMQASVTGMLILDSRGNVIFSNERAVSILGLSDREGRAMSLPGWPVTDSEGLPVNHDPLGFQEVLAARKPLDDLVRIFRTPNGDKRYVSIHSASINDNHHNIAAIVVAVEDITTQTHSLHEMKSVQDHLRQVAESVPAIVFLFDLGQKRLLYLNRSVTTVLGYHPDYLLSKSTKALVNYLHPDDQGVLITLEKRYESLQKNEWLDNEVRIKSMDGAWRTLSFRQTVFKVNNEGKPEQIIGAAVDISDMKALEASLQQDINLYQLLAKNINDVISRHSVPDLKFTYVSPASERLLGYLPDDLIKKPLLELVHKDDHGQFANIMDSPEDTMTMTFRMRCNEGNYVWFEVVMRLMRNETGDVTEIIAVSRDISERKATQEALEKSKDLAESVNRAKSEFLANMSHEIRTPLNAIIGMTSLLFDTRLTNEQRDYVDTVRSSGDSLLGVINDILDLSKIEAGRMELEQQPFDLRDCIESAMDLVAQFAAEKSIDLAYFIAEHVPSTLIGDVTRLRQVLVNLLSNAVKFTDVGEVIISITSQPLDANVHELFFAVKDTGIGIPKDRQGGLFEAFSQVDASTTRKYGGSGLGLAISKRLVEVMGGHMWVDSKLGEGSTFQFTIQSRAAPSQGRIHRRSTQPLLRDKHVLIVDDNATNRTFLIRQLENWGMNYRAAASGQEALEYINQGEHFDIALLDMQMPGMDGGMLASEIVKMSGASALPMIIITSLGSRDDLPKDVKFSGMLHKPIKPIQLYNALMNAIESPDRPVEERSDEAMIFDENLSDKHPLRILLAEDNLINQKVAMHMLERLGYRCDVAANGIEVLEALRRQPYDIVLMDIQMPEMDGEEATKLIRQLLPESHQPSIIAMTAHALEGDRERYMKAGMNAYISKPVSVYQLKDALLAVQAIKPRGTNTLGGTRSMAVVMATKLANRKSFEIEMINQLKATVGGKADTLSSLVESYLEETPHYIASMREALEFGDIDRFRRIAHNLKGLSATFGAMKLSTLCEQIETLTTGTGLEAAEQMLDQAEAEFRQVENELVNFTTFSSNVAKH